MTSIHAAKLAIIGLQLTLARRWPVSDIGGTDKEPPQRSCGALGVAYADDAGFIEADHPRGPDGKFTSGAGGGKFAKSEAIKPDPKNYNAGRAAYIKKKFQEVQEAFKAADPVAALKLISENLKAGHGKTKAWIDQVIADQLASDDNADIESLKDFKLTELNPSTQEKENVTHESKVKALQEHNASLAAELEAKANAAKESSSVPETNDAGYQFKGTLETQHQLETILDEVEGLNDLSATKQKVNDIMKVLKDNDSKGTLKHISPLPGETEIQQKVNNLLLNLKNDYAGSAKKSFVMTPELKTEKKKIQGILKNSTLSKSIKLLLSSQMESIDKALTWHDPLAAMNSLKSIGEEGYSGLVLGDYKKALIDELENNPKTSDNKLVSPGPSSQVQQSIFKALKDAPHKHIETIARLQDASGKKVKTRINANTEDVPGDHYAKVTSAYGNEPENGMTGAVDQAMTDYSKVVAKNLTPEQRSVFQAYRGNEYQAINKAAAGVEGYNDPAILKKVRQLKEAINQTFIPADTPVYRGVTASIKALTGFDDPAHAVGRCFEHKNFASVSRSANTASSFGSKTLLHFTIPAGTPGYVMDGQAGSGSKGYTEREILLNARSMFRIDKVERWGDAQHIIHCTYLGTREDD